MCYAYISNVFLYMLRLDLLYSFEDVDLHILLETHFSKIPKALITVSSVKLVEVDECNSVVVNCAEEMKTGNAWQLTRKKRVLADSWDSGITSNNDCELLQN